MLAEFALLAFVVWLLLAGVLELGRALSAQQVLQHAARTIAREMSRLELPHDASFEEALRRVLDTRYLVIDAGLLVRCDLAGFGEPGHGAAIDALFDGLPVGNKLLRPLMIADRVGGIPMIRYPGAVLRRTDADGTCGDGSIFTVGIPQLDAAGTTVRWRRVVEPDESLASASADRTGFALGEGGWVGVRLHYPFQSAGLLQSVGTGVIDPRTGRETQTLVDADRPLADVGLETLDADLWLYAGTSPAADTVAAYGGTRGLGRLFSLPDSSGVARTVRPYRRLLSASAGFRREIFVASAGAGSAP